MDVGTQIQIADIYRNEIGELTISKKLDIEIGETNNFELTLSLDEWEKTGYGKEFLIYIDGTEYGGFAKNVEIDTAYDSSTIKFDGYTWRGLLQKKIIEPPSGLAYRTVSGEANAVMRSVASDMLYPIFVISSEVSAFTVNYQFDRYTDMLTGFTKMLKTVNAKLQIRFDRSDRLVHISAVPIVDYSDQLEYSTDNNTYFKITESKNKCNHLICLGSGELTARQVVHLYIGENGEITTTKFFTQSDEIVEVYDYPNAEDLSSLTKSGTDHLTEIKNSQSVTIKVENVPAEIGDIVGGRERISGYVVKKPITGKIYRISGTTENIELKVGD